MIPTPQHAHNHAHEHASEHGGRAYEVAVYDRIEAAIAENYDGTPVNPSPAHSSRLQAAGAAA